MAPDRVHLSVAEAREHAGRALRGIGYDAEETRIPGERAFRSRERLLRDGIDLDRAVYEALAALHA